MDALGHAASASIAQLSPDGRTLVMDYPTPRADGRKHDSRVWRYPTEDFSAERWAFACRCGAGVVELETREEAERHEREHTRAGWTAPATIDAVPPSGTLRTSKGDEVEVRMSDEQAYEALRARIVRENAGRGPSDFVVSLVSTFGTKRRWSAGQRPWAHKLANEERERAARPAPEPKVVPGLSFERIIAMFAKAAETLKHPAVVIGFEAGTLRLALAGGRSKFPGSINVTSEGGYAERAWYGRVHRDGRWEPSGRGAPEWVTEALVKFNENPAEMARLQGQRYGACCFCRRELTTKESLAVGYGPVCAEKFGLPWGDVPADEPELAVEG